MKNILLLIVCTLCLGAQAKEGFRVFTDTQGRAVLLKVVGCDLKHDEVTVELEDERRLTVKASGFCESDQEYIKEWYKSNELISERNLKISIADKVVSEREEELTINVSYSGGDFQEEKAGEQNYENIAFQITFENKGAQPIQNARVEYIIYYEQSVRGSKDPTQKILSRESRVSDVGAGKKATFQTESVEIMSERLTSRFLNSNRPADGDVHGIRGRLIVKISEEKTVVREFKYPNGLSDKKYPWGG